MEVYIDFANRNRKEKVSEELRELIRRSVTATLESEGVEDDAEVSVTFVSNAGIRKFNREYRGIDRATDVLSFPIADDGDLDEAFDGERLQLGDVVLSLERAREQSETFGHSFEREVAFLTVHSVLHLLGYDHEKGEEEDADMRRRQSAVMEIMNLGVKEK